MYFVDFFLFAGEEVKQADVILLGFPLMMSMPEDVRKNDLRIYENVIDSEYFFWSRNDNLSICIVSKQV